MLELARTSVALIFMLYASWSDYKLREVSNKVWVIFAPVAFILTFTEICTYDISQLQMYGISFGLTAFFSFLIFYSGGFGGADAKAMMCLALALPFFPTSLLESSFLDVSPISRMFFPLSVFSNSVLLAALMAFVMLFYNIFWRLKNSDGLFAGQYVNASPGKKLLLLVTGRKVSVSTLKQKWHVYPLEDLDEGHADGVRRRLTLLPKDEGRDATVQRLEDAVRKGTIRDAVWATPGLPFLIFVTAGLVTALFLGDIVWICLHMLLG